MNNHMEKVAAPHPFAWIMRMVYLLRPTPAGLNGFGHCILGAIGATIWCWWSDYRGATIGLFTLVIVWSAMWLVGWVCQRPPEGKE